MPLRRANGRRTTEGMALTDRFKKMEGFWEALCNDPDLRDKYDKYMREHKKRLRRLEQEASGEFLERPTEWHDD